MKNFHQGGQYNIDLHSIRLDTFRLLSYISLGTDVSCAGGKFVEEPISGLCTQFAETEITSVLITIAIKMRVLLEQRGGNVNTATLACGHITDNYGRENGMSKGLDIREAFNKIIHSKVIRFPERSHNPIDLYGDNKGVPWNATLDTFQFVKHVCSLALSPTKTTQLLSSD